VGGELVGEGGLGIIDGDVAGATFTGLSRVLISVSSPVSCWPVAAVTAGDALDGDIVPRGGGGGVDGLEDDIAGGGVAAGGSDEGLGGGGDIGGLEDQLIIG